MCRIFGFRSVINSQVHHSLVHADNALNLQSQDHPDGWGVAYYVSEAPHIIKSEKTALTDSLFSHVSGVVSSETVVAHIRNATLGKLSLLNTHPFQLGPWVFAHNGNIKNFDQHRASLQSLVSDKIARYILGNTDSELIFYIILTELLKKQELTADCSLQTIDQACKISLQKIETIIGPCLNDDAGSPDQTYLTFLITNGKTLYAHQGGKKLYYSTHKKKCKESDSCTFFVNSCEAPSKQGEAINHLILSSEPLSGDNIWLPMEFNTSIGVDKKMLLSFT